MSAFRILDPRPVYFDSTGAVAAGGSLKFFATLTTNPQDVYGDSALSVNNGSVLTLGTDGRTSVDVFGDSATPYRVQLFDVNGNKVFDVDPVQIATGLPDPTGQDGKTLQSNGTSFVLVSVAALPTPTGNTGKVVGSDGTNYTWVSNINPAAGSGTTLTDFILKNVRDTVQQVTAAATTEIDFSAGGIVLFSQAADCVLTIPFVEGATLTIHRVKDNTATARAITWPSTVKWPGGTAPSLTQAANAHDVISLQATTGPNWLGSYVLDVK